MSQQTEQPKKNNGVSGLGIPGGLLIGLGVGFITGNIVAGVLIGLGSGFLVTMFVRMKTGEW